MSKTDPSIPNKYFIPQMPTQANFANMIGSTRETVSRSWSVDEHKHDVVTHLPFAFAAFAGDPNVVVPLEQYAPNVILKDSPESFPVDLTPNEDSSTEAGGGLKTSQSEVILR